MRDIPVFTTENGVASLIFKEIPYSQTAYVKIQDTLEPKLLLEECVSFCRMVGAEQIFASGHLALQAYPFHTAIVEMRATKSDLPETDAALFPLQDETLEQWRGIYNTRMQSVPNWSYMTAAAAKEVLRDGSGYFVHKNGQLLGIGIASGDRIDSVISVVPGSGRSIVAALTQALCSETVCLEVASANLRAVQLYESLGFFAVKEISMWYKIF